MFRSIVEPQAINRFLRTNDDPRRFRGTKKPDKIIAAVRRGHSVLDSYPLAATGAVWIVTQHLLAIEIMVRGR